MKKTAVKLVAVLATAILALTGCAKNNPNVAATVGDQTFTMAQVDALTKVLVTYDATVTRRDVAQILVISKLAKVVQNEVGVKVSDAQRQQVYSAYAGWAPLLKDPATSAFMADFADYLLVMSSESGAAAFQQVSRNVPVALNPVFGSWDASQGKFSGDTGSLSKMLS